MAPLNGSSWDLCPFLRATRVKSSFGAVLAFRMVFRSKDAGREAVIVRRCGACVRWLRGVHRLRALRSGSHGPWAGWQPRNPEELVLGSAQSRDGGAGTH